MGRGNYQEEKGGLSFPHNELPTQQKTQKGEMGY